MRISDWSSDVCSSDLAAFRTRLPNFRRSTMWTDATRAQYARADLAFGREVRAAQAQRRKRLVSEQLAEERDGRTVYRRNILAALQRRELLRVASRLSAELGKAFVEMKMQETITGRFARAGDG